MEKIIQHFSHGHPLVLRDLNLFEDGYYRCNICQLAIFGVTYACRLHCYLYIHKSCSEFPREINHPFHPQHRLTLVPQQALNSLQSQCSACGVRSSGYYYDCPQCRFSLDINCAALMPKKTTKSNNKHQINHYLGEPHPLILCDTEKDTNYYCSGCKVVIKSVSIYVCFHCKNLLHKSCTKFPQEIESPFHPNHTLTLLPLALSDSTSFCCSACSERHTGLAYRCLVCENFDLDIKCSFLIPIIGDPLEQQDLIDHHSHPLILCKSKNEFPFYCACEMPFKDDDCIFCCLDCKQLLHKSCAKLPFKIEHMFHPQHTLWLYRSRFVYCNACKQITRRCSAYVCKDCEFEMDLGCALSTPLVLNSSRHKHPLTFFSNEALYLDCDICRLQCKSHFFRCVPCNYNVHILCCIPTPPLIASDGNHRHPLTFTKSQVKDFEDEDENAEFYCDTCEKERRLRDPTYYCAKCHYVAHVHCVISEIVRLVNEEWSLAHKLSDTMLTTSSTNVLEENTNEVIRKALTGELEEIKSDSHSSLVDELDKEMDEVQKEVEELEAKLEALRKRLEALREKKTQTTFLTSNAQKD